MIAAADKTSAATVAATVVEDALAGAVDVDVEHARKEAAICLLRSMHHLKASSARTIPAVATIRAARNQAAVSSHAANSGARKAHASVRLPLRLQALGKTRSYCPVNPSRNTETSL